MSNITIKKRNWSFFVYPESAPDNWLDLLCQTGLPFAVSPLHDRDVNPDGEIKKAHFHIIVCYDGPTTFKVVERITTMLNSPHPQYVDSVKGYYRYFTHKDNPEKYQYNECDIRCYNGFNIFDYAELTSSEILALKRKILDLIAELKIYEYSDLIEYLMKDEGLTDLLNVASNHTLFFNSYLKSRRYRFQNLMRPDEKNDDDLS